GRGACCVCVATPGAGGDVPWIRLTSPWVLEPRGWERLAGEMRDAGATSMIVADLPAGDRPELHRVQLVAPTTADQRLRLAAESTDGWLYLVTVTGTTGARQGLSPQLGPRVRRARGGPRLPLYAGFGIATSEDARAAAELADGVVVGSAAVAAAEAGRDELTGLVRSLRRAL